MQPDSPDPEAAKQHILRLYGPTREMHLAAGDTSFLTLSDFRNFPKIDLTSPSWLDDLAGAVVEQAQAKREIFFGNATRRQGVEKQGTKTLQDLAVVPHLWADVDTKKVADSDAVRRAGRTGDKEGIRELIASAFFQWRDYRPDLIVLTPGGVHAYWCFDRPLRLTTANFEAVQSRSWHHWQDVQRYLCALGFGNAPADQIANLDRILRPCGSVQVKTGKRVTLGWDSGKRSLSSAGLISPPGAPVFPDPKPPRVTRTVKRVIDADDLAWDLLVIAESQGARPDKLKAFGKIEKVSPASLAYRALECTPPSDSAEQRHFVWLKVVGWISKALMLSPKYAEVDDDSLIEAVTATLEPAVEAQLEQDKGTEHSPLEVGRIIQYAIPSARSKYQQ